MFRLWPGRESRADALLKRARLGDRQAFRELYAALHGPVYAYVARRTASRADAEDLVARTFERLLLRLELFDEHRGGALPFALTMARSLLVDDLRARRPGLDLDEAAAELVTQSTPLSDLLKQEELRALNAQLRALPAQTRELLALRYGDGLSTREVAQVLGLSEVAVRQRLSRAVQSLRREPDEEGALAHET
ncbi:MAG: sigma-70 family RNA polymerase sigma factor [Deltaproteobacteria bacterium]|nr:sigma-70 family RNA polymerase sigma factor [Deltaproteobacteria bacterium]